VEDCRVFAMENGFAGGVYAMGSRVPLVRKRDTAGTMTQTLGSRVPSRVVAARSEETCTDARMCQKPVSADSLTLPIALGVW
jgi:hypothetical protein